MRTYLSPMDTIDIPGQITDREAGYWATRELVQRELWAMQVGRDPHCCDLMALPPVEPEQRAA